MIIDLDSQRPAGLDPVSYLSGYREGCANRAAMRSKAHRVIVRYGPATFIIVACIGLVVAAHVGRDRGGGESAGASAMEETTGSIGDSPRETAELALSDEERGRLYESVMRIADASVANVPAPAVADALPSGVPLQDLPGHGAGDSTGAGPQIREVRRPDRGGRSEEPRGGGHDSTLQAAAVTWLAPQPRVRRVLAKYAA
jgi:hypothetical protein